MSIRNYDVIVIGAGGAGMMCALEAGKRRRTVALIERSARPGRKILLSGGGRCNFTNLNVSAENFVSQNPHFSKSALARFTPDQFIARVKEHGIAYHEKKLGQLFCDGLATQIVDLFEGDLKNAHVDMFLECSVSLVEKSESFLVETNQGTFRSKSLVIATGGLSFPRAGATDFGYQIAKQFGHKIVETAPALVGFSLPKPEQEWAMQLAGVSMDTVVNVRKVSVRENILFTHVGLSGPAILQASLHWMPGDIVSVNFLPDVDAGTWLLDQKNLRKDATVANLLTTLFPHRFCEFFADIYLRDNRPIGKISNSILSEFGQRLNSWTFKPTRTAGYAKAEVTRGGVSTDELSSSTMESKIVPGLYFIGEVVDVTGWLGGYNFQWAWASGHCAGQVA